MREIDRDILRMTGHLLDDPKRRVRAALVVNDMGHELNSVLEPTACRWCLVGAIAACRSVLERSVYPVSPAGGLIFQLAREYLEVECLVGAWALQHEQERIVERLKAA
jgi:hypothetical protein